MLKLKCKICNTSFILSCFPLLCLPIKNPKICFSLYKKSTINLFQPKVAFHIETNHLFFRIKQMTGFYMKDNAGLKWEEVEPPTKISKKWGLAGP